MDSKHGARHNARHSTSSVVRAMFGMMTAGKCDGTSICKFRNDWLFGQLVGGPLPSVATFRQRLDSLAARP